MSKDNGTLLRYDFGADARTGVRAFSTTRHSPFPLTGEEVAAMGSYAAFNVTDYCGDSAERVERNAEWLAGELGISRGGIVLPRQTHTANVFCVDGAFLRKPAPERHAALQGVDALLTDRTGVCIGVSTADCVPLLLYDPVRHAAAAVHAGWRGTVARIAGKAVAAMRDAFASSPGDLRAVIGPGISQAAFEVGEEVVEAFSAAGFPAARFVCRRPASRPEEAGREKPHIDLWAANAWLLEEAGVPLRNIQVTGVCTYARHLDFFSARRLGVRSGRIFTGVVLRQA